MHRVLTPNGRLGIAVWRSIEGSPGYLALARALERKVDASAARLMDEPFCLSDGREIRALLEDGGFREINGRGLVTWPASHRLRSSPAR